MKKLINAFAMCVFLFLVLDTVSAVSMTVVQPHPGLTSSRRIPFEIYLDTTVSKLTFVNLAEPSLREHLICTNCNQTGINGRSFWSLFENNNVLIFKAYDEFGEVITQEEVDLVVDSISPRIVSTFPRTGVPNNGSLFQVKYTEENPSLTTITIRELSGKVVYQEQKQCGEGRNILCSFSVPESVLAPYENEKLSYQFSVNDGVSSPQSRLVYFLADTSTPISENFFPQPGAFYDGNTPFAFKFSEPVTLEYKEMFQSNSKWNKLCSNCKVFGTFASPRYLHLKKGDHDLSFIARDSAGNAIQFNIPFTSS